jgi:hypothetical protein
MEWVVVVVVAPGCRHWWWWWSWAHLCHIGTLRHRPRGHLFTVVVTGGVRAPAHRLTEIVHVNLVAQASGYRIYLVHGAHEAPLRLQKHSGGCGWWGYIRDLFLLLSVAAHANTITLVTITAANDGRGHHEESVSIHQLQPGSGCDQSIVPSMIG